MTTPRERFRDAMARVPAAVHVVTTDGPAGRAGFTASAVCSLSDDPPMLLVCLNRQASVHPAFEVNRVLCVNTLGAGQAELSRRFGGKTPMSERFEGARWSVGVSGAPVLDDALASFDCRVARVMREATHDVLVCEIVGLGGDATPAALVYQGRRYHELEATAA